MLKWVPVSYGFANKLRGIRFAQQRYCCDVSTGWVLWNVVICRRRYATRRSGTWFCLGWTVSWTRSYRKWWSNASHSRYRWNISGRTTASHGRSCPNWLLSSVSLFWLAVPSLSVAVGHECLVFGPPHFGGPVHRIIVGPSCCSWSTILWLFHHTVVGPPCCLGKAEHNLNCCISVCKISNPQSRT